MRTTEVGTAHSTRYTSAGSLLAHFFLQLHPFDLWC